MQLKGRSVPSVGRWGELGWSVARAIGRSLCGGGEAGGAQGGGEAGGGDGDDGKAGGGDGGGGEAGAGACNISFDTLPDSSLRADFVQARNSELLSRRFITPQLGHACTTLGCDKGWSSSFSQRFHVRL